MAVRPVLAIRDSAVGAFQAPFVHVALGAAVRAFGDAVKNPESGMDKHPEDYELYHLADFDEVTGLFIAGEQPVCIARGKDYISKEKLYAA